MESSPTSMLVEAALSALFQGLFDKLALPFFKRNLGHLFGGVEREAKSLSTTLLRIQSLLTDAENRQINEESVRLWLSELKDVAYDAEDILDELAYIALQSKIEEEAPIQTRKRKFPFQGLFSRASSNLDLGSRIKEIRERLDEIFTENNHLHLKVTSGSERLKPREQQRRPTSSIVDESIVFGREADREKVVGLLLTPDDDAAASSSAGGRNVLRVIPICGMGGLGKTTLAQLVYNDERVETHFKVRAWVYVSEDFDLIRLTKAIAESVPGGSPNLATFANVQCSIKEALNDKRFLLVLDDVWNENFHDWDALQAPLMSGARGSRILVTTRSQRVSSNMGTVPTHFLQGLSDDECWSLFERRAFAEGNSDAHPDLKKIGKEIVKKCNGLPLAVKSLGGLLRSKVDVVRWEAILKSEIWSLPEDENGILPALRLSYHHLPAHLKRCFAYCCIFPKGFEQDGDQLVFMWMAQGYIHESEGSKQMEDIGREYLADLVSRSLLDEARSCVESYTRDKRRLYVPAYTMHDLSHDLARSVLGAELFELGDVLKSHKNIGKARHISHPRSVPESFNFEDLYCLKSLRTLLLFGSATCINNIPADFFVNSRHIRLLDLSDTPVTELPESIESLMHLRHLDLSKTQIERLPQSTTRLYHLQTLMLKSCFKLVELPSDLSNLVNLRCLCLWGCPVSIPPRIGRLTSLQTLGTVFDVGKENGCRINELKHMILLGGSLNISKLENVVNVQEAKEVELRKKEKIWDLSLEWKYDDVELRQEGNEEEVLEGLQPHANLKELQIRGYCGSAFPRWLGDSSFSNLVTVSLLECRCHLLPSFGRLPALKDLVLYQLYGLKNVGREFYGDGTVKGFASLQRLSVVSMPDLEEWYGLEGNISRVSELNIKKCCKLRELPFFPLTLERVEIEKCERLASLPRFSTVRELTLSGCDERILSSLQYLTSLSYLKISGFSNLTSLPNGLLQPLTTLETLHIREWHRLMSLGDEDLPTGLKLLCISHCNNLNCLPNGMQNLTSLQLSHCHELHSLPEELPTTLKLLNICRCPLLEEKCRHGGEYWCKLSNIPTIRVDNTFIKRVLP